MIKKSLMLFMLMPLITQAQKKWTNLLDKPEKNFHIWQTESFDKWTFERSILSTAGGNPDLVTNEVFGDFILEFKFKVAPKGNSGVIYKVLENATDNRLTKTYSSGPEYQIIDDENYEAKLEDNQKSGANYALNAPLVKGLSKPAGKWNKGKIIVRGNEVTHWLNGKLTVRYIYGDEAWKAKVDNTKFAPWPYSEPHHKGHIALQDHGDAVWFRVLRIKELGEK